MRAKRDGLDSNTTAARSYYYDGVSILRGGQNRRDERTPKGAAIYLRQPSTGDERFEERRKLIFYPARLYYNGALYI